jgi:hypothetical protein
MFRIQRQVAVRPMRLRRKFIRFSTGSERWCRICSISARSLSFFERVEDLLSPGLALLQGPLFRRESLCRLRIGQGSLDRTASDAVKRIRAVDGRHEIQLQGVGIPLQTDQARHRIKRPEQHGVQIAAQGFQLLAIAACGSNQEIQIDGRYGRTVQRRRCVSDENRFEPVLAQQLRDEDQDRFSAHVFTLN